MASTVNLRRRLIGYVVVVLMLTASTSGLIIYSGATHEADEYFSASLVQTARVLDSLISRDYIETNRQQILQALERNLRGHHYERKLFFAVVDSNGEVLLHTLRAPEIPDKIIDEGYSEFRYKRKSWLTYSLKSSQDNLRIIVGERSDIREEIFEYVSGGLVLPLVILAPAALWILWIFVGLALRPLDKVTDQIRQQDIRRLHPVAVESIPKEISPLVDALNQMIDSLDAAYNRERRFASDAAHEMRNPLAGLLINVDNALEESQGREVVDSLQSMKSSIQRLSHLVAQLLELSRFENPQAEHGFQQLDLSEIAAQVAAGFTHEAVTKNIEIELDLPRETCPLTASEPLLRSLISNLVDNAIKFSADGCRARLTCVSTDGGVLLSIEDSGAGLDAAERERVLGRFYRAGDTNSPGAGLGLSIVKSIADIHLATVELAESELGGLAVRVHFPAKH